MFSTLNLFTLFCNGTTIHPEFFSSVFYASTSSDPAATALVQDTAILSSEGPVSSSLISLLCTLSLVIFWDINLIMILILYKVCNGFPLYSLEQNPNSWSWPWRELPSLVLSPAPTSCCAVFPVFAHCALGPSSTPASFSNCLSHILELLVGAASCLFWSLSSRLRGEPLLTVRSRLMPSPPRTRAPAVFQSTSHSLRPCAVSAPDCKLRSLHGCTISVYSM